MLGCYIMIGVFAYVDQDEATAKEAPMKAANGTRLWKIFKIIMPAILTTAASVAGAALS
jgi:hypothetical protein